MKIISWNIASIRKFNQFDYFQNKYDIIAIQEIRYNNLKDLKTNYSIKGYHDFWSVSKTPGYSGCGIYVKSLPLESIIDEDGRYIILLYDHFIIINVYVMNSGEKLQRLENRIEWDKSFRKILFELTKAHEHKKLILIGDMNCSVEAIDVKNPRTKLRKPGYTFEERHSFKQLINELNFIDTFRYLHPDDVKYSYFSYRNNARKSHSGWRLDYVLVSKELANKVTISDIEENVVGSDHVPIICNINIFLNGR